MNTSLSLFDLVQRKWSNWVYLLRSNHSFINKIKILLTSLRLVLKFFTIEFLLKLKKERIMGFKVNGFNYATICFLFDQIFLRNEYLLESKNKKPVILDCGANIGIATLFFKWLYPDSEIYAFEPDKDTFSLLKKNVEQNGLKNVKLFNVAILDKEGKIDFFIDPKNPGDLKMSTSFERILKGRKIVDCVSLSQIIKGKMIDFLKMDIEGSEKEVLQEMDKSGTITNIKEGVIEYHHKIGKQKSNLSIFLEILERNGFEYQIDTQYAPLNSKEIFQDILIYFYKR